MTCTNCHSELPLRVCRSAAGYYVGRFCDNCGPHGRDSGYFADEVEATDASEEGSDPHRLVASKTRIRAFQPRSHSGSGRFCPCPSEASPRAMAMPQKLHPAW